MADEELRVATFEQISTRLSQILQNYSELSSKYRKMFIDTNPELVDLELYRADGTLETISFPNRAMDFRYIKNGSGSPDGVISAPVGTIFQDTTNGDLYIKQIGSGNVGWVKIDVEDTIVKGFGSPEGSREGEKGSLYIDIQSSSLYIKTTPVGPNGWILISANTSELTDRNLENLTPEGESHFANPDLSNLTPEGEARLVMANPDLSNLTPEGESHFVNLDLSNLSPEGNEVLNNKADSDLSNLTEEAQFSFVGNRQVEKGILYAKKGLLTIINDDTLYLPDSMCALFPNGKNTDYTLKNTNIILDNPLSRKVEEAAGAYKVFWNASANGLILCDIKNYFEVSSKLDVPVTEENLDLVVWAFDDHKYWTVDGETISLVETSLVEVGTINVYNNGLMEVTPEEPFNLSSGINITYEVES